MLHDISIAPEALKAAAAWVEAGANMASVEMRVDDDKLIVTQGDEQIVLEANSGAVAS